MSISAIGAGASYSPPTQNSAAAKPKVASDGDSAAVEAAESASTKRSEQQNGGRAVPAATATASPAATATSGSGSVNLLV
ncbi:MAG: hypothetical protein P4M15_03145 [Alphaproteobacteria bacterium]|nr:hypothetical protein [Alphaproteobacteria bacterium]